MAQVSSLVPDIKSVIPEIVSFVAERELLRATREFCEETRAWRVSFSLDVTASTATIDLTSLLPANTELVDIISVKPQSGGQPVVPKTYSWMDANVDNWRNEENADAQYYMLDGNNTVRLYPTPANTTSDKYYVRVAVKPTLSATVLDDVLVNKHREALISGALGYLFMLPRKLWSDMKLAQYHLSMFHGKLPSARAEAADEFQTGVARSVKYGGY